MWYVLSKHDSGSQSGNTLRYFHYYKRNTFAIIIIDKEDGVEDYVEFLHVFVWFQIHPASRWHGRHLTK